MPEGWLLVGRDLALLVVAVLVFYWGADRKKAEQLMDARFRSARAATEAALVLRDQQITEVLRRLDHAGAKQSDLASLIQGLIGRDAVREEQIAEIRRRLEERG